MRPAAYLNLAADAMHNFTDGLALGVTFAQGKIWDELILILILILLMIILDCTDGLALGVTFAQGKIWDESMLILVLILLIVIFNNQ